jgi:hypothetical protein
MGQRQARGRFAYDMGFALEPVLPISDLPQKIRSLKSNHILIGFNPSGLLASGGYNAKNMFGLKADYWLSVDATLSTLFHESKCHVLLVPHVFGPETNGESDVVACKKIYDRYHAQYADRLHYFPEYLDHHETKFLIGQCDFFLGSRMHACIAALSQCVPAVGLAYSRKFIGVMELVGDGAFVIDLRHADVATIAAKVNHAWQKRLTMQSALLDQIPKLKLSVLNLCSRTEILSIFSPIYFDE